MTEYVVLESLHMIRNKLKYSLVDGQWDLEWAQWSLIWQINMAWLSLECIKEKLLHYFPHISTFFVMTRGNQYRYRYDLGGSLNEKFFLWGKTCYYVVFSLYFLYFIINTFLILIGKGHMTSKMTILKASIKIGRRNYILTSYIQNLRWFSSYRT